MKKTAFLFLIALMLGGTAYAGEGCSMSGHKAGAATEGDASASEGSSSEEGSEASVSAPAAQKSDSF